MTSLHEVLKWGEMAKGLMAFPTAPSRVACLPEYFMYCNYFIKAPGYEAAVYQWYNLVPRVCLFAGYVVTCRYITREQAYSGNEIG
jgi:hypothetical protein